MEKKTSTTEKKSQAASSLGRLGGLALAKTKGKRYMKKLAKAGAEARWKNKSKKQI